jgi:hypothetical protein
MRSKEEIKEMSDEELLTSLLSQGRPYEPPLFREARRRKLIGRLEDLEEVDLPLN